MSKRNFTMVDHARDAHEDFPDVDGGHEFALPSSIALPSIPGQYPGTVIYAAPEASHVLSSIFTTALKFAPGFGLFKDIVTTSTRYAQSFFSRPQNIRAEPVYRGYGSRKKILLDAGLDDTPSTPTPNPRGIVSRRNKESKHQARLVSNSLTTPTSNDPATPISNDPATPLFNNSAIPIVKRIVTPIIPGHFPSSPPLPSSISEAFIVHNVDIIDPLGDELVFPTQVPTFDEDLSELPDAPPVKKSVRFSNYQKIKYYYNDCRIDDVMDSFIEEIQSTPMTPEAAMDLQLEHLSPYTPTKPQPLFFSSPLPQGTPETEEGYYGIPSSTWDDSSDSDFDTSEHSLMSSELLDELLRQVSTTPETVEKPAVIIEPLIAPLTEKETNKLHRIAAKSDSENASIAPNLSIHDFKTLLPTLFKGNPSAWLNDQIVNEYLSIIINHQKAAEGYEHRKGGAAPPVHNFASQFYSNLRKSAKSVGRWAARKQLGGPQLLDCRLVLIPLCDASHWRLVAVRPMTREIEYLDSLSYDKTKVVEKVQEWLALELGDDYIEEEWMVIEKQLSQQQLNGNDCGVFTCLNALALVRGEEPSRVFPCKGMDVARRRIAMTLMKGQPTTEF